jgi:hypothetical protein
VLHVAAEQAYFLDEREQQIGGLRIHTPQQ